MNAATQTAELNQKALSLPEQARALVITNQATFDAAGDFLKGVVAMRAEITGTFGPLKQKAFEAHRAICAEETRLLQPVSDAERIVKGARISYQAEQERIRQERERQARLEAERQAAELRRQQIEAERHRQEELRRQREAEEAERQKLAEETFDAAIAAGADEGTLQEIVELAAGPSAVIEVPYVPEPSAFVPLPVIAPTVQKTAGISLRKTYRAEVVSLRELCRAVADGRVPESYVTPALPALNRIASAQREQFQVPGCRVVVEQNEQVRTR